MFEQNAPSPASASDRGAHADEVARMVAMLREISRQTDPQAIIPLFRRETFRLYGGDGSVSLSRRELEPPQYRITRSTRWTEDINPWNEPHRLPLLCGGILAEVLYGDEPRVLRDIRLTPSDPAHSHMPEARALMCLPLYDGGVARNMVVRWSADPGAFDGVRLAEAMLTSNLFGRATNNLLVAQRLQVAYGQLDHEMKRVAALQRSLLPQHLPDIPTLDIAASYQTAAHAGGDYYDFFPLPDGRWGLLIADVSGHGVVAAVLMAMLRTMLHVRTDHAVTPAEALGDINRQLCGQARRYQAMFVTAFYGIYDPADRSLLFSCAGHNPPLLVDRHIHVCELDQAQTLPLAVEADCGFDEFRVTLAPGDTLLLYTDGIIDAVNENGEPYGRERLLSCVREDVPNAQHIIDCVMHKLLAFTHAGAQQDDQTLVAMRVRG
jgi:sigma-B regulation protein RsbU (phosphoserine phosphatase)